MKTIAVINRKGGVGKTTISGNLAAQLIALGDKAYTWDLDPQKSLTAWGNAGESILKYICNSIENNTISALRESLEMFKDRANWAVLDTPPGFETEALLAAAFADLAIIPCGPSPLDLSATKAAIDLLQGQNNLDLKIALIPSRVQNNTSLGRGIKQSLKQFGLPVLPAITNRTIIAQAALTGKTIPEHAPGTSAGLEFKRLAIEVKELI